MSDTPLSRLAAAAEKATDEFANAVDACSAAESEWLTAYHLARADQPDDLSDAKSRSEAEQAAWREKVRHRSAEWGVERAKAVLRTRLAVLSAAQSHARAVERQT